MKQIIDAHTHLFPAGLPGFYDPAVGATYEAFGRARLLDGRIIQKMPALLRASCFDAELLINLMDEHGIEKAILMQGGTPAFMQATAKAAHAYPDRLEGAMVLNLREDTALQELERYAALGLHLIKFDLHDDMGLLCPRRFPNFTFDSSLMLQILEQAAAHRMTIVVDPGSASGPGYQIERFSDMVDAFPTLRFVFCHLGFPPARTNVTPMLSERHRRLLALAKRSNVWFDIAALPEVMVCCDYPYAACTRQVRQFIDQYGADRIIWGSDIPGTLCGSTYRQLIALYDKSPLFSEREKHLMFYQNAISAYFD